MDRCTTEFYTRVKGHPAAAGFNRFFCRLESDLCGQGVITSYMVFLIPLHINNVDAVKTPRRFCLQ